MNDNRDVKAVLADELAALRQARVDLEQRVMDRTIKLMRTNEKLRLEIEVRKKTEKELAEHREHLEELVEERTEALKETQDALLKRERLVVLGQLTATVSHELRNPLGVIRSSVFEPLFTTRAKGTGLGLAIVEKIVSEHDGEVSLESRPNKGTTVKVMLPISDE